MTNKNQSTVNVPNQIFNKPPVIHSPVDVPPNKLDQKIGEQSTQKCPNFCKESGFWILPLKYGVEGKGVEVPKLPENLKKDYANLELSNFNYVAEMVTNGFIYVCIKRAGQAKAEWLGYTPSIKGYMSRFDVTKQLDTDKIPVEPACNTVGHKEVASIITLPSKGNKIISAYLLYTHVQLSTNKMQEYEKNAENYATNGKWQKINPHQWSNSQNANNCLSAKSLNSVYKTSTFDSNRWKNINGVFNKNPKLCAALVLHDPIGITKKLNEERNSRFEGLMSFLSKGNNQHKLESSQMINTLKFSLEHKLINQSLYAKSKQVNQSIKLRFAQDKIPIFSTNIDQREYSKEVDDIWNKASEAEKKKQ